MDKLSCIDVYIYSKHLWFVDKLSCIITENCDVKPPGRNFNHDQCNNFCEECSGLKKEEKYPKNDYWVL